MKNFENFLVERHILQYEGLDGDDMETAYADWLDDLDLNDWISLGNQWGLERTALAIERIEESLEKKGYAVKDL